MASQDEPNEDEADLDAGNLRNCCLLLFSNPFGDSSHSFSIDKQIELIPIVAQQRYVKATRDFIEQSSPSMKDTGSESPISVADGMESKTFHLPKPSNRSKHPKLPPIVTSFDYLPATVYNPNETFDQMSTRGSKSHQHRRAMNHAGESERLPFEIPIDQVSDRAQSSPYPRNDYDCFTQNAISIDPSDDLFNIDDPEAFFDATFCDRDPMESSKHGKKDLSERIGIPSPVGQGEGGSSASSVVHGQLKSGQYTNLEAMIRAGLYDPNSNDDEAGFYISLTPSSEVAEDIHFRSVNPQGPNISHDGRDFDSVYAQVFHANPFGIDLSPAGEEDLSMRATLFPLYESPVKRTSYCVSFDHQQTPESSAISPVSSSDTEDEINGTTKDFHSALSSIAKNKNLPSLPGVDKPAAKAMSLLGQFSNYKDFRPIVGERNMKRKLGSMKVDKFSTSLGSPNEKPCEMHDASSQDQQVQDMTSIPSGESSEPDNHRSKADSILGKGINTSHVFCPEPPEGPRTNSTLFNKLYSQVLKPTGSYRPDSGFSAWNSPRSNHSYQPPTCLARYVAEPVKRATTAAAHTLSNRKILSELPVSPKSTKSTCSFETQPNFSSGHFKTQDQTKAEISPSVSPALNSSEAYHAYKALEKMTASNTGNNPAKYRLTFQDMVGISDELRNEAAKKYHGASAFMQSHSRRTSALQGLNQMPTTAFIERDGRSSELVDQDTKLQSSTANLQATHSSRVTTTYAVPSSPVKKIFFNTVEKIGRMMPVSNNNGYGLASNGVAVNEAADLKISIHAAEQNRLFGDLEYIIQDTTNRFLLFQHARGRLSSHSVEKQARAWHQKNRPQVAQFLYPIAIQRDIVAQNLDTISFHGPLAGNPTAIQAIMHTWKYVAQELAVRSFCLPDAGLQHFLREAARLLESLGVTDGHMLHFHAWYTLITKTIQENYQIPYSMKPSS